MYACIICVCVYVCVCAYVCVCICVYVSKDMKHQMHA